MEQARPANAFLCNETHYRALKALTVTKAGSGQSLRAAYFLHIPYATQDDYQPLAEAVAALLQRMVRLEQTVT